MGCTEKLPTWGRGVSKIQENWQSHGMVPRMRKHILRRAKFKSRFSSYQRLKLDKNYKITTFFWLKFKL